ncbi:hypothetical protein E4T56_gene17154 [Termitomyces sp. T112]|nr:hypothetical protein E4T56_gene17154 [Termitomyces sp. T112]
MDCSLNIPPKVNLVNARESGNYSAFDFESCKMCTPLALPWIIVHHINKIKQMCVIELVPCSGETFAWMKTSVFRPGFEGEHTNFQGSTSDKTL